MEDKLREKIALSMLPGITAQIIRDMAYAGFDPTDLFSAANKEILSGLDKRIVSRLTEIPVADALTRADKELEFIKRHSIRALFLLDDDYPRLLAEIPDAPIVIYKLGSADLDSLPSIAVVGTRKCTSYGLNFTPRLISDLAAYFPKMTVVSGLALGIDSAAHLAALNNNLPTVAVVAHGLDMLYPAQNRLLARRILDTGGAIITEHPSGTRPFRNNFLLRNRIIAGLSELTFIVESEVKGGAMSTANQAFSYSREVMALPGRVGDISSSGCNSLISRLKAHIYTSVPDMMNLMNWQPFEKIKMRLDPPLFPELEGEMGVIYQYMRDNNRPVSADELKIATNLPMPQVIATLTDLEFEGVIVKLPGARYELS